MTSVQRNRTTHASRLAARGLFVAGLAALGGCSADVTRFDFPAFNLSDNSAPTGSLPASSEPLSRRGPGYYEGPRGAGIPNDNAGYQPTYQPDRGTPSGAGA